MIEYICDLHTHTTLSDGKATPEYLIAKAREGGYQTGISDHLFCSGNETSEKIDRYLSYASTLGIPVGGETNIGEELRLTDRQLGQFDYLIASIHAVFPESLPYDQRDMSKLIHASTDVPYAAGATVVLSRYFAKRGAFREDWEGYDAACAESYLNLAYRQMEHYFSNYRGDILGHAGVMPFYDDLPYESAAINDWEDAVVSLCKKYGVAMEISGMWRAPYERMLQKAKAAGLRFSFGSDCHRIEDVGDLRYCLEMAERIGLSDSDLFRPGA